jgi:uncharacterized protein
MVDDHIIGRDAPYVRFFQIDVLRGFALLGIFWINVFVFGLPALDYYFPPELNDESLVNSTIGIFGEVYIEGTMRGLFSILFGASALIFLDEAKLATSGTDLVDRYYRRAILLLLFGVVHAYLLLWPYDVLYAYGLFGLFLFPLRKLPVKVLLTCGLVLLAIGDLDIHAPLLDGGTKTSLEKVDVAGDDELTAKKNHSPRSDALSSKTEIFATEYVEGSYEVAPSQPPWSDSIYKLLKSLSPEIYHSGYATIFSMQKYLVVFKQSIVIYQDYLFDIGGMMLLGMALLKMGVLTGQRTVFVYLLLAVFGYGLGTVTRYFLAQDGLNSDSALHVTTGYNLGRLLIVLGHIGLVSLFCRSLRLNFVSRLFAGVGRMALTNYIMQTVISIFIFYGFGFGFYAELERYQLTLVCIGVWLFQIAYSNIWLIWYKHGPLEWAWRSMIYGNMQSLRRSAGSG